MTPEIIRELLDIMVECPHCTSPQARYVVDHQDVTLRCMCGYCKVVASKLAQMTIEHIDAGDNITLPRKETGLWKCMTMLYALETANTLEITTRLNGIKKAEQLTVSEVASQLTVLRYKGLVRALDARKGLQGGSTWEVTDGAKNLLGKE